jgi:hypothetical protein
MLYATKIKMCPGCQNSNKCQEIDSIYLEGCNDEKFYKKAKLYDYLQSHPNGIKVKRGSQPYVIPALSVRNEKYVKSEPNDTVNDNLLNLPRY